MLIQAAMIEQVRPVALYFVNEFGTGTAIFDNLVRGEFHFAPTGEMGAVRAAKASGGRFADPERMLVADRRGQLREHLAFIAGPGPERATPESLAGLWAEFLNWMLFGANVLARGERARALRETHPFEIQAGLVEKCARQWIHRTPLIGPTHRSAPTPIP